MSEKRFALIIANDKYNDESLRELQAPQSDADALAKVLGDPETCNFLVQILVNRRAHRVNQVIEAFFDDRGRDDLLLLYFSGHGVKDEDGKLYFATPDTKRNRLMSTAVSASFINDLMRRTRSRRQVLLLDCCFSGAFAKGMIAKSGSAVGSSIGTSDYFQGRGRVVLTASDAMQYAFEEDELVEEGAVKSIFTSAIVDGIESWKADRDRDDRISITELYDYVDSYVHERTPNQRPSMWSFDTQGEIVIAEREYIPEVEEEEVLEFVPEVVAEVVSEEVPEEVHEVVPEIVPEEVPKVVPEIVSEEGPEDIKPSVDLEPPAQPVRAFPLKQSIALLVVISSIIGVAYWQGINPPRTETEATGVPMITYFTTEDSTLRWSVEGATSVTIIGIGSVASTGTRSVSPDETTTYTLTAMNREGSTGASVQVVVIEPVLPVIDYFTASPSEIGIGGDLMLSWSVSEATSVTIFGIGSVASTGTRSVSLDETTTYTLTATNEAGSVQAQAVVEVIEKPVIHYFTAGDSTLSWSVSGATVVTINQGIGSVPLTGTSDVSPIETTTYTLTATNEAGSVQAQAVVIVSLPRAHTVTLIDIVAEDGHVQSDGYVNPYPNVGSPGGSVMAQAFLSFDISDIPAGSTILDVIVDFSSYDTLGDPFIWLGCITAYLQDYGTLDAGDYYTSFPLGEILRFCSSGELDTPESDPDVASALQGKVGSSRFQMRLQFASPGPFRSTSSMMVRFSKSRLTVTYIPPD